MSVPLRAKTLNAVSWSAVQEVAQRVLQLAVSIIMARLLQEFDILEAPGRELFPIHYNVLARKVAGKFTPDSELHFRFI
jgi:hypothetical protein